MVGTHGSIHVHDEWQEPMILWFIISARKGERKTPALRRVVDPILILQKELRDQFDQQQLNNGVEQATPRRRSFSTTKQPPQLLIDLFSMEELHRVMKVNDGQVIFFH